MILGLFHPEIRRYNVNANHTEPVESELVISSPSTELVKIFLRYERCGWTSG